MKDAAAAGTAAAGPTHPWLALVVTGSAVVLAGLGGLGIPGAGYTLLAPPPFTVDVLDLVLWGGHYPIMAWLLYRILTRIETATPRRAMAALALAALFLGALDVNVVVLLRSLLAGVFMAVAFLAALVALAGGLRNRDRLTAGAVTIYAVVGFYKLIREVQFWWVNRSNSLADAGSFSVPGELLVLGVLAAMAVDAGRASGNNGAVTLRPYSFPGKTGSPTKVSGSRRRASGELDMQVPCTRTLIQEEDS